MDLAIITAELRASLPVIGGIKWNELQLQPSHLSGYAFLFRATVLRL